MEEIFDDLDFDFEDFTFEDLEDMFYEEWYYYDWYDYYEDYFDWEEAVESAEQWVDFAALEEAFAELFPDESFDDLRTEEWSMDGEYYILVDIETPAGVGMYVQQNGVYSDGECMVFSENIYDGSVTILGYTGPAENEDTGEHYCGVLFTISEEVRDGDYLWLYLTDNSGTWLDIQLIIGEEVEEEESTDSIADASDFDDAYYAAMDVFYRLDHHQMIYMEEWFEMGLQQISMWVEAGEEFGVVFITDVYGAFEPTVELTDDSAMLIESANYYLADTEYDSYVQFNAWEVDRYTEGTEASAAYSFVFDDEDKSDEEFTVNIERLVEESSEG
jgi:hypothetical protein